MAFRILFVDDEKQILTTFQETFAETDYTLYTANNGVDALVQVKAHRPDMVFLDVVMPEMKGAETLRLIHEIDPSTVVVIISGYVSEEEAKELLTKGAYDFLLKPVDLVRLQDIVEQVRIQRELS